jgi:hypothetical protein
MNSIPGTQKSDRPPLPDGWVYTDEVEWSEPQPVKARRRRVLLGAVAILVAVLVIALVVLNAQRHYARGVAALQKGDYALAQTELSAATLLVLPYRDSARLADHAVAEARLEAAKTLAASERVRSVTGALESAATALKDRDPAQFTTAIDLVPRADLRVVLRRDAAAQRLGQSLSRDVATIVEDALRVQKWDKAEAWTAALLALRPDSSEAAAFTQKVKKGRALSARLSDARDAARRGEWRKALRLALGIAAVREGFPGTSSLIADARRELAGKRAKARAAARAATSTSASTGSTSSGSTSGSSSGSSSAPAPP